VSKDAGAAAELPGSSGIVVLNTVVTPELEAEGLARDLVRCSAGEVRIRTGRAGPDPPNDRCSIQRGGGCAHKRGLSERDAGVGCRLCGDGGRRRGEGWRGWMCEWRSRRLVDADARRGVSTPPREVVVRLSVSCPAATASFMTAAARRIWRSGVSAEALSLCGAWTWPYSVSPTTMLFLRGSQDSRGRGYRHNEQRWQRILCHWRDFGCRTGDLNGRVGT
jgi:hypothetical protein